MKKVLMVTLAGLLTCSSVQAGNFIIGGNFGLATGGKDAASLNNELKANGIDAEASTSGDIRSAWQAYLSYQFLQRWGMELAYVDLGEATIGFSGIDQDIVDILNKIGSSHPRSAQGVRLSGTYRIELNKNLQLQSKLGAYSWETNYTFSGLATTGELVKRDITLTGTDVTFGLGLVHKLTNNTSAHLDWDFYTIDGEVINMFSFGASYLFY